MSWVWDVKTDVIWVWNVKKEVQVWKWDVKKGNEILMKEYFTCCHTFLLDQNIVRIFTHTISYYVNLFCNTQTLNHVFIVLCHSFTALSRE